MSRVGLADLGLAIDDDFLAQQLAVDKHVDASSLDQAHFLLRDPTGLDAGEAAVLMGDQGGGKVDHLTVGKAMGGHRTRGAVQVERKVNVVDHQVGHHVHVGDSRAEFVGASEVDADDTLGLVQHLFEALHRRIEAFNETHLEIQVLVGDEASDRFSVLQRVSQGLLDEDVSHLAGRQTNVVRMRHRGCADDHSIGGG